jgi:hypothetical protein
MAEKQKTVVLTVKQKLHFIANLDRQKSATNLVKDYGIGLQIICDIKYKKSKYKLMKFARSCNSVAGHFKHESMGRSSYKELDVVLLQWFSCLHRKPKFIDERM